MINNATFTVRGTLTKWKPAADRKWSPFNFSSLVPIKVKTPRIWPKNYTCSVGLPMLDSGRFRGAEPTTPTPALLSDDWRRHSRYSWYVTTVLYYGDTIVTLANAKFWSFYCKTWYSEYSKWLPPAAIWQLQNAPNSFSARALPRTPLGGAFSALSDSLAGLRGPTFTWGAKGRGKAEEKGTGMGGTGPPYTNPWIRPC